MCNGSAPMAETAVHRRIASSKVGTWRCSAFDVLPCAVRRSHPRRQLSWNRKGRSWARETFASLTPYLAPTRYVNYLEDDALNAAAVAYGPNLAGLRAIKTKYDPANVFRHNVNILPN
jgi:hypothetical protein